jgi:hypothetical protein
LTRKRSALSAARQKLDEIAEFTIGAVKYPPALHTFQAEMRFSLSVSPWECPAGRRGMFHFIVNMDFIIMTMPHGRIMSLI